MADSIFEGSGGGGIVIGDPISGGTANEILFGDGSANVAQSSDLFWDDVLKIWHAGDFSVLANGTVILLDDQNSLIGGKADMVIAFSDTSNNGGLYLNTNMAQYVLGGFGVGSNKTNITIDDTAETVSVGNIVSGGTFITLDNANHGLNAYVATGHYIDMQHQTGSAEYTVIRAGNNVGSLFLDNLNNQVKLVDGANHRGFLVDYGNKLYQLGDIDSASNKTLLTINDAAKKVYSTGVEVSVVAGAINFTNAPSSDQISRTTGFTGLATTTYTITVAGSGVDFDWTDGTNSGSNIPMDAPNQTLLSHGISVYFVEFGTYTPGDYYTFTFTVSNVNIQSLLLDYGNAIYKFGDTLDSRSKAKYTVNGANGGLRAITDSSFSVTNTAGTNSTLSAGGNVVRFAPSTGIGYTFTGYSSYSTNDYIISDSSVSTVGFFAVRDGNYNNSGWIYADPTSGTYYFGDVYNDTTRIHIEDSTQTLDVNSVGTVNIGATGGGNATIMTVNDVTQTITDSIGGNAIVVSSTAGTILSQVGLDGTNLHPFIDSSLAIIYDGYGNTVTNFSEANARRFYTAAGPEAFVISNTQVQSSIDFRAAETFEMAKRSKRIYVTQTASFTPTDRNLYYVDATGGNITITLPTAVGIQYQIYTFKRIDNSVNTVTFASTSSQTIDTAAATTFALLAQGKINVQSDNANRFTI